MVSSFFLIILDGDKKDKGVFQAGSSKSEKENAHFYYALFSESGFDEKIRKEAELSSDLKLYSLEEIVNI